MVYGAFMAIERLYTQGEIKKIFSHIPPNTLLNWARTDLVPWEDERKDRRGVHRLYSIDNLYVLGVVEKLLSWRIKPHIVQNIVNEIHDSAMRLDAGVVYIVVLELETVKEPEVFFLWEGDSLDAQLKDRNFITSAVVDVAGLKQYIIGRIKAAGL